MKIVCPQCEFTRAISADKLPANAVMATCPQCQHRFRVTREDAIGDAAVYSDNAVPRGAHIPSTDEPLYTQGEDNKQSGQATQEQEATEHTKQEYFAQNQNEHDAQNQDEYGQEEISLEDRQKAAAAYAEQANENTFAIANPWEYASQTGYFTAFYQTVIWVLFSPSRFFAGLMPQNSRTHIMVFYLIVRVLQISIEYFWGGVLSTSLEPAAANDPELQTVLGLLTPQSDFIMAILLGTAMSTIEIFLGSLFYFTMFKFIAKANANFSLIFQVVAYSSAPLLLAIIPAIGTIVGFIWSLACILIGCRYAMRLSWSQTILGVAPLYILGILSFVALVSSVA